MAIFAKEMNDGLTGLVKKIEAESAKHSDCEMGSFVVFCNDDDRLEKQLKDFIAKEKLKKTVVAIDKPAGPRGYKISPDADVTVVLYVHKTVKANYAFKKGELTDKAVAQIVGDLPKILPESK